MEHRWGSRVRADVEVELFAFPASAGWGRIRDISTSGCFVETPIVIAPLTRVRMRLFASGFTKDEEVLIHATVVRQTAAGLGAEWTDWNIEAIARLVREAQEAHAEERGLPSRGPAPEEQPAHLNRPHSRRTEAPPLTTR
jgi:hypothetical protein